MTEASSLIPIRVDSYGSSGPRCSSTNWYPLGRWLLDFRNEYNNLIQIEVINKSDKSVQINIRGPSSRSTNAITRVEAEALRNVLNVALDGECDGLSS